MRRALGAAALLSVLLPLVPPPAASAQQPGPQVSLASQTTWVDADERFRIRVDVDAVEPADQLDLEVAVYAPVRFRSEFDRTLQGALLYGTLADTTVPVTSGNAEGIEVTFAQPGADQAGAVAVDELDPGVYPVSVRLRRRGGPVVDDFTTHLLRSYDDPAMPPLSVGVVVPFGAPPALRADGSTDMGSRRVDQLAAIAEAVDVEGAPLTLVPTPETIVALDELDHDEILDGLRRSVDEGSQVVASPYVELPPAMLGAPRLASEVTVQRLTGAAALQAHLGSRPDPTLRTVAGPVDRRVLASFDEVDVDGLVADESALGPLPSSATRGRTLLNPLLVDPGEGAPLPAVVADAALTRHFTNGDDQVLAAHHLLADLAVLFGDSPGLRRGTAVVPPRGWNPDGAFLRTVLEGLASSPMVEPVTIDELLADVDLLEGAGGRPVVRPLLTERAGSADVGGISVADARTDLAAVGAMTGPANADLAVLERLLLVSQAAQLAPGERQPYTSAVATRLRGIVDAVTVPERESSYRLTAREGTIPVALRNDNDFPVKVLLRMASDKLEFIGVDGTRVERNDDDPRGLLVVPVTLDPGNNFIAVRVLARASGEFPLHLELQSPGGTLSVGREVVTIRSTVASGVGIALSIGAGLFLLVWWARHWRTARRDRRLIDGDDDAGQLLSPSS